MSVYSGFSTRTQEKNYNALIEFVLNHIISHLMSSPSCFINGVIFNEKFSKKLHRAYLLLRKLEDSKYMKPHLSKPLEPMITYLQ
jgi:hypothetical protein